MMRRFLNSEVGPVPITAEMSPEQQEIFRAANAGVLEALSKGKQTNVRLSNLNGLSRIDLGWEGWHLCQKECMKL